MFPTESATEEKKRELTQVIRAAQDLDSVWISYNAKPWFGKEPHWTGKVEYARAGTKIEKHFKNADLFALIDEMKNYHSQDCDVLKR